jgi:hypothetical protein
MEPWIQTVITIFGAVIASTGFWAYLQKALDKKDIRTQMLIGLGHDRITYLGMQYLERYRKNGICISQEEYENLNDYLYKPYKMMGGNGSAERIMQEVNKIPIGKSNITLKGGNLNEQSTNCY